MTTIPRSALMSLLVTVALLAGCTGGGNKAATTDQTTATTPTGTNLTTPPPNVTNTTAPPGGNQTNPPANETCPPPGPPVSIADAGDLQGTFEQDYPWILEACAKTFTIRVAHAGSPPYPIRIGGIGYVLSHNDTVLDQVGASLFGLNPAEQVLLNLDGNRTLTGNWNLHIDTGQNAQNQVLGCYCHYEVDVVVAY